MYVSSAGELDGHSPDAVRAGKLPLQSSQTRLAQTLPKPASGSRLWAGGPSTLGSSPAPPSAPS